MYKTDVDIYIQTSPPLCGLKLGNLARKICSRKFGARSSKRCRVNAGKTSIIPVKNLGKEDGIQYHSMHNLFLHDTHGLGRKQSVRRVNSPLKLETKVQATCTRVGETILRRGMSKSSYVQRLTRPLKVTLCDGYRVQKGKTRRYRLRKIRTTLLITSYCPLIYIFDLIIRCTIGRFPSMICSVSRILR